MKQKLVFFMLLIGAFSLFAAEVTITAPTVSANTGNTTVDTNINNAIKPLIKTLAGQLETDLNAQLNKFETPLFAQGVANAGVFASSVGQGYARTDFGLVQINAGFTVAMQSPASNPADVEAIGAALESGGDVLAGIGAQGGAQVSLNLGFLVPNLVVGIRGGTLDFSKIISATGASVPDGFSGKTAVFGIVANYRLIKPFNALVFEWKGVNIGSGLIYQGIDVSVSRVVSVPDQSNTISTNIDGGGTDTIDVTLSAPTTFKVGVSSSTLTIPLEVSTGVRVLFLNVSAGLGADLAMGGGKITMEAKSGLDLSGKIYLNGSSTAAYTISSDPSTNSPEFTVTPGSVAIDAGTVAKPAFVNFKVFASPAIVLPFVSFEFPMTYYVNDGSGLSAGITMSISF